MIYIKDLPNSPRKTAYECTLTIQESVYVNVHISPSRVLTRVHKSMAEANLMVTVALRWLASHSGGIEILLATGFKLQKWKISADLMGR